MSEVAEDAEGGAQGPAIGSGPAVALALGSASRAKADTFLEEQTRLARLQAQELSHELGLRHWSLWVRHLSGLLKLTLEVGLAVVAVGLACFIGAGIWNAAHSDGLVIESFSVPPDLTQRGLTGQVVAGEILDRLTEIQNATVSSRSGKSFAGDWGDDIKVEIPDTGISIAEVYRFLRRWLGHESHVGGSVWHDQGSIVVTVHAEGKSVTVRGPDSDVEGQLRKAAEGVFHLAEPYRYAVYLGSIGRDAEGIAVYRQLIASGSPAERAWAEVGLARTLAQSGQIDQREAARLNREAAAIDPGNTAALNNLAGGETALGHLEAALQDVRAQTDLLGRSSDRDFGATPFAIMQQLNADVLRVMLGAYGDAMPSLVRIIHDGSAGSYSGLSANLTRMEIGAHDLAAARAIKLDPVRERASPLVIQINQLFLRQQIAAAEEDWRGVLAAGVSEDALLKSHPAMGRRDLTTSVPLQAHAKGRLGDIAGAEALIATTPPDCDVCMLQRARIADLRGQHGRADWWFARAVADAPSIPLVYAAWGQALLERGKPDDAIAQFKIANHKGPHFADPLEGWGEALMAKNQSHLALAKFAEADKYAPNWGRLHLKWGEALAYSGKKAEARAHFARAATLDLTSSEKSELARTSHG